MSHHYGPPPSARSPVDEEYGNGQLDLTVHAVIFDLDGTLVDSTAAVEASWAEFARVHGLDLPSLLARAHGRRTVDTVRAALPNAPDAAEIAAAIEATELCRTDGIVEIPGAASLLASLPARTVAVVTSASADLARLRLRAAGLPVPQVLICAGDVTEGKPSPEGYLKAAAALQVPPAATLVFEDAESGIAAARAAGATTVVVGAYDGAITRGLFGVPDYTGVSVTASCGSVRLRLAPVRPLAGR